MPDLHPAAYPIPFVSTALQSRAVWGARYLCEHGSLEPMQ